MSKKILLTGAAGFIGFHLASFLQKRGDQVVGIDNFNSYYSPELKRERAKVLKHLGVNVLEGDIVSKELLEESIKQQETTHLVHLAAQAGVRYSLEAPQSYIRSNVDGFMNILEACRNHPHIKLTYASSSSVYGKNSKVPFSVDDPTDSQTSLYGVTKKSNELMAKTYHHLFGLSVTGLRFFSVYGPWGRPDMAYYSFSKAILENKPIDIYENGTLLRDFTYISDIVLGIAAAIDLEEKCEIFNLGNHHPISVMEMVEILEKLWGMKAIKRFLPMPNADVPITYADISYSKQKLNFEPKISLETGLQHFKEWYSKHHF